MASQDSGKKQVVRQIEFYFSEQNWQADKYLQDLSSKDADFWIPLNNLCTFKRIVAIFQQIWPKGYSTDRAVEFVADAIKDCDSVQISRDKTKLRRVDLVIQAYVLNRLNDPQWTSNRNLIYLRQVNDGWISFEELGIDPLKDICNNYGRIAEAVGVLPEVDVSICGNLCKKKVQPLPNKAQAIVRQMNYYFSQGNLARDLYLQNLVFGTPEGWVDISILEEFPKMKALNTTVEEIVDALRNHSDILQVSPHPHSKFCRRKSKEILCTLDCLFSLSSPKLEFQQIINRCAAENKEWIPIENITKYHSIQAISQIDRQIIESIENSLYVSLSKKKDSFKCLGYLPTFEDDEKDPRHRSWVGGDENASEHPEYQLTVMTYNVLADYLTSEERYPYLSSDARNWDNRKRRIISEISHYSPHILCLQEVQSTHLDFFRQNLAQLGYQMRYVQKTGTFFNGKQKRKRQDIGNAICWKQQLYTVESIQTITTVDIANECKNRRAKLRYGLPQVALAAVLRKSHSGYRFLVCTAHISANWKKHDVQLMQAAYILREISKLNKEDLPVLFCGDFNSTPETAAYQLLREGFVFAQHEELKRKGLPFPKPSHDLNLRSAYQTILGREPAYTNFVGGSEDQKVREFKDTLDYIFVSHANWTIKSVLDIPSDEATSLEKALPNSLFPSDHVPLLAKLEFKTGKNSPPTNPRELEITTSENLLTTAAPTIKEGIAVMKQKHGRLFRSVYSAVNSFLCQPLDEKGQYHPLIVLKGLDPADCQGLCDLFNLPQLFLQTGVSTDFVLQINNFVCLKALLNALEFIFS